MGFSSPGLPYLKGASTGSETRKGAGYDKSTGSRGSMDLFNDPAKLAAMNEESLRRARMSGNNNGNGGSVSFGNVQSGRNDNGNPMYQKGTATMTMPDGTQLEIPNMVAQQLQFEQWWNQGRANVGESYFNTAQTEATRKSIATQSNGGSGGSYVNWDVTKQRLANYNASNAQYTSGSGAIGEGSNVSRLREIDSQIATIKASMMGQVQTEVRTAGGQMVRGTYNDMQERVDRLNNERQGMGVANNDTDQRIARMRQGESQAGAAGQIGRIAEMIRPTVSNLRISETLVK